EVGGELQDVATDGIGDFDFGGGIGEFAGVAGGLEMVEEGGGEHGKSIATRGRGVEGEAKRRGTVTRRVQRREEKKRKEGQWCPIVRARPSRRRRAKDGAPSSTSLSGVTR